MAATSHDPGHPRPRPSAATAGRLWRDLAAGAVVGVVTVVVAISLASLIYDGALASFRAQGIALALLSTVLGGAVVALLSSLPGTIGHVQDTPAAVLAAVAAAVTATAAAVPNASSSNVLMTAVATIAATTMLAGLVFLTVGLFGLGSLVRYLPYPVIGGFMAGTGWLLIAGSVGVMSGSPVGVDELHALLASDVWPRWGTGLVLASVLLALTHWIRHPMTFPAVMLVATTAFFALVALSGDGVDTWRDRGYLLGPFQAGPLLPPLQVSDLQYVHWPTVAAYAGGGASVVFLALLSGLLNTTGLELGIGRKVDLNRELRAAGLSNLLTGSLGGAIVYQGLGLTMLIQRIGSGGRAGPFVALGVCALTLMVGPALLELVPTVVVGGVLAYLGLSFLVTWLVATARSLPWVEYAIVLAIALTIGAAGVLTGVAVGLALTVLLFVVTYARVDAVKHALTGSTARSRVRWEAHDRLRLDARGDALLVLQLHGFLFFGTANGLVERVERRLDEAQPLSELVLDFRQVTGMDATAAASFVALRRLAETHGFELVLSEARQAMRKQLERVGLRADSSPVLHWAPTLDAALEWCERRALAEAQATADPLLTLSERLELLAGDHLELQDLLEHLDRIEVPAGHRVLGPEDPPGSLYLLASGQVTSRLNYHGAQVRLETLRGGNLVGELGLASDARSDLEVVTDEPSTLYRLDRSALAKLGERDPALLAGVYRLVAHRLAGRVAYLEELVAALRD